MSSRLRDETECGFAPFGANPHYSVSRIADGFPYLDGFSYLDCLSFPDRLSYLDCLSFPDRLSYPDAVAFHRLHGRQ